jgi:hypothetical protein
MSTHFYDTDQQDRYSQTPAQQPSGRQGGPSWPRIWGLVVGTVAAAALVVLAAVLLTGHSSTAPATAGSPASATAQPTSSARPTSPVSPVRPSAAVMQLQRELGQLNYYEGPVDGITGPQTIAAIEDLQRQAGLPQTGQMNAATQAALANYLAHGNNQMGGNS